MSKPVKVGLIGAGGISGQHMRGLAKFPEQVQLTAVCDIHESAARARAEEAGGAAVYTDVEKMLREADIEAVDICTIHDQHASNVLASIAAGKHVLIEKPMGCSLQECRDMVAAADKAGVTLMVAQCQRYMPTYRSVKRLIERGELGTIRAVRFDSMQDLPSFAPNGHWLCDAERAGGGIVISVSVHRIDLMRYLVGDIRRVSGVCRSTTPLFTHGAENFAAGLLEFENGAIGEMFATYTGYRMPWGEMFMIFGDEGTIHAVPQQGHYEGDAVIALRKNGEPITAWEDQYRGFTPLETDASEFPTDDGFANEVLHFVDCIRAGKTPDSSGKDNLNTMATIFGIYESVRTGQTIDLKSL